MPNPTKERQKVEQIVASLSEAQRRAIMQATPRVKASGFRIKMFVELGVAAYQPIDTFTSQFSLTPLGLAVRSFIQENGK